jgi:phosphate transport system ATP-binding protein
MNATTVVPGSDAETTTYTLGEIVAGPTCCQPSAQFEISNLSVVFGEKPVLNEVSLSVYKGCITALIGPSGCGKTSFLSALNRMTDLLPTCKVSGSIRFEGQELLGTPRQRNTGPELMALRRRIGFIFQKPNPFPVSIRRNLDLPLREHGIKDREQRERKIEAALRDVGLWDEVSDRLEGPALALSGGQQQRLCIARALVLEPSVLLMDEPCSALDPIASGVVEKLITRLAGRYTIVIVTHNLAQARRIANYAAFFWMRERIGKLVEFGRCQQLFDAPKDYLTAAYVSGHHG